MGCRRHFSHLLLHGIAGSKVRPLFDHGPFCAILLEYKCILNLATQSIQHGCSMIIAARWCCRCITA